MFVIILSQFFFGWDCQRINYLALKIVYKEQILAFFNHIYKRRKLDIITR